MKIKARLNLPFKPRLNIASPEEHEWEELSHIPAIVCYPATVVDYTRQGIWVMGGKIHLKKPLKWIFRSNFQKCMSKY